MEKMRAFKHGLDPLIRKLDYDVDAAASELIKLQETRSVHESELESLVRNSVSLEEELRRMQRQAVAFDVGRYETIARYLTHQREMIVNKRREVNAIIASCEKVADVVRDLKANQRAFEVRRAAKCAEHLSAEMRRVYRLGEEEYLMRWNVKHDR